MLSYRHAFHAGNFADVHKHTLLCLLIEALLRKEKPFCYLDTHAGLGLYDLDSEEARKTGEYREGIARLWERSDFPAGLEPYMEAVRAANGDGALRCYPGSPVIARHFLRPQDRMLLSELNRAEIEALHRCFGRDAQVAVHHLDAYQALKALLPPAERRGLVLIDAPFDQKGEFARLIEGLKAAHRRWATGIYAIWYPLLEPEVIDRFHRDLKATGIRRILVSELSIHPEDYSERMRGSGMVVVNPPWQLDEQLRALQPWLWRVLSPEQQGGERLRWLVGE